MKNIRINGWDNRDYRLWSELQSLPHYGLVAGRADNPMLARKDVEKLLELAANKRFDEKRAALAAPRSAEPPRMAEEE